MKIVLVDGQVFVRVNAPTLEAAQSIQSKNPNSLIIKSNILQSKSETIPSISKAETIQLQPQTEIHRIHHQIHAAAVQNAVHAPPVFVVAPRNNYWTGFSSLFNNYILPVLTSLFNLLRYLVVIYLFSQG